MNIISKIATTHPNAPAAKGPEPASPALAPSTKARPHATNIPPALSTTALAVPGNADNHNFGQSEAQLKRQGIESLVAVLRSLVAWGTATERNATDAPLDSSILTSPSNSKLDSVVSDTSLDKLSAPGNANELSRISTPDISDDPGRFESAKQRKTVLQEGIKRFNNKPKKGVEFLVEQGFIPGYSPEDISKFLLYTDGLSKTVIGEYMGEGLVSVSVLSD